MLAFCVSEIPFYWSLTDVGVCNFCLFVIRSVFCIGSIDIFLLVWVLAAVSFKEFVCFTKVVKFVAIELLILFLYYSFSVHGIWNKIQPFISDVNNLCPFFFLLTLPRDLIDIIDPVKEWAFGFADFLYQFFSFIDLFSNFYSIYSAHFGGNLLFSF